MVSPKNKEVLDWMKKKHSNILVIYVLLNYTNFLQPINVILQQLLKHAFKMTFNGWTTNIINSHIDTSANLHVDSKWTAWSLNFVVGYIKHGHRWKQWNYVDKRLGENMTYTGLGWWLSTCSIGGHYNNSIVYNCVGDCKSDWFFGQFQPNI